MRDSLRQGLQGLPAPRNDFEIVIPENMEGDEQQQQDMQTTVEDQTDIDNRRHDEIVKKREILLFKVYFNKVKR